MPGSIPLGREHRSTGMIQKGFTQTHRKVSAWQLSPHHCVPIGLDLLTTACPLAWTFGSDKDVCGT